MALPLTDAADAADVFRWRARAWHLTYAGHVISVLRALLAVSTNLRVDPIIS